MAKGQRLAGFKSPEAAVREQSCKGPSWSRRHNSLPSPQGAGSGRSAMLCTPGEPWASSGPNERPRLGHGGRFGLSRRIPGLLRPGASACPRAGAARRLQCGARAGGCCAGVCSGVGGGGPGVRPPSSNHHRAAASTAAARGSSTSVGLRVRTDYQEATHLVSAAQVHTQRQRDAPIPVAHCLSGRGRGRAHAHGHARTCRDGRASPRATAARTGLRLRRGHGQGGLQP